ncbi:hypothetical protein KOW79_007304 [Hemibagrus wyckioides]|uniref:Protein Wnt n=1 Tax=Hemibagrus wyckioides TaxID=337641 RepID=A0A9D3NXR1_9TELE|nr:hypothetical protein KOW79_007304 [Hemibagrus wyckioides]
MYTLTKNCSMGDFDNCGCDDSKTGKIGGRGWIWGGCSDNADFGENISKQFVDALENGHDSRAAVNRHNNEAGRLAIKATMKRSCKCHGVSGSCSVQTCWMQLSDFRDVGNYLKIKYDQAQKLELDQRRMRTGNSAENRGAIADTFSSISRTELIHLEDSPNYCIKNLSLGLHGTEGRECLQNGNNLSQFEKRSCRRLCHECGLKVEEKRIEIAYLSYTSSVLAGAQNGMQECKHQFAWDRWNCPESTFHLSTHRRLRSATRETSFVHAISAAGVMYTLTRNCSLGDLDNCGCDNSRNGKIGGRGWLWGGCSDNVDFGERISKQYVDAFETGQDARAAVNLHNNAAGRLAVKATMKRICRCHGMSESCAMQTCWMQLAEFREVGNYLKVKHDQAHKLELDKRRMRAGNSADNRGGAIADAFNSIARSELIYLEDSPDYCAKNLSLGLHGTEGRECLQSGKNLSQWEKHSCRRLCHECGLRVEEIRTEIVSSCNCKFHWCCTVKCENCTQIIVKYVCARRQSGQGYNRRRLRGPK